MMSSSPDVMMQGFMMKKKKSPACTRSLLRSTTGSYWIKRYYVLHSDGTLVYYKIRPGEGNDESSGNEAKLACANVSDCIVDRLRSPSDEGNTVANSFYITRPGSRCV